MRKVYVALCFLILSFLVVVPVSSTDEKPLIVTTTSVLGSIVKDLAGDSVRVISISSPAICPAHYDIKPSDVYAFSKADLILYHGFEPWVKTLAESSGTKAPLVKVSGNWNTPDGIAKYYEEVAKVLKERMGIDTSNRLDKILSELHDVSSSLKAKASSIGASKVKVIAMGWVKPFVSWLGFDVVADFGPPEKLSSADVEKLVEKGKAESVTIVISNLQSGTAFGERLASEIGAVHVVLTNFPWTEPGLNTLIDVLKRNSETLFKAVELYKARAKVSEIESELSFYRTLSYSLIVIAIVEAIMIGYVIVIKRRWGIAGSEG